MVGNDLDVVEEKGVRVETDLLPVGTNAAVVATNVTRDKSARSTRVENFWIVIINNLCDLQERDYNRQV